MKSPMNELRIELARLATSDSTLQPLKLRSEVSRPLMPASSIVSSPVAGSMPNWMSASIAMLGPLTPSEQEKPMPITCPDSGTVALASSWMRMFIRCALVTLMLVESRWMPTLHPLPAPHESGMPGAGPWLVAQ